MMEWVVYCFLAAFARTVKDVGFKEILDTNTSTVEAVLAFWTLILVCLAPFAYLAVRRKVRETGRLAGDGNQALIGIIGTSVCDVAAYWCFLEALRYADFAVTLPLRNTVPFFAFFVGVLLLREKASMAKFLSAGLVVAGVLVIHRFEMGALLSYSSLLAIGSAALFSISVLFNRFAVAPDRGGLPAVFFSFCIYAVATALYAGWVVLDGSFAEVWRNMQAVILDPRLFILIGVFGALGTVFTAQAFVSGEVTLVVPMLRVQVLMSVIAAGVAFGEHILVPAVGSALLLAGLVLLVWKPRPKALAPA